MSAMLQRLLALLRRIWYGPDFGAEDRELIEREGPIW